MFLLVMATTNSYHVLEWKSEGWSNRTIKPLTTQDNSLAPGLAFLMMPKYE